jgi:hypothetical protein
MSGKNANDLLSYLDANPKKGRSRAPRAIPRATFGGGGAKGGGRFYQPPATPAVKPEHHGGGFSFGGMLHDVGHPFVSAGHHITHYSDLAAHDIEAMPTGLLVAGKAISHDSTKAIATVEKKLGVNPTAYERRQMKGGYQLDNLGKQMAKQTYESVRHPGRDPFETLLTALMVVSAGAGAVGRIGASASALGAEDASVAARLGAAGKALTHAPKQPFRIIHVPHVKDGKIVKEPIQFSNSERSLGRAIQGLHDKLVQRTLDKNAGQFVEKKGPALRYAHMRTGKAYEEMQRRAENIRAVLSGKLGKLSEAKSIGRLNSLDANFALFLRSANVLPEEAMHFLVDAAHDSPFPEEANRFAQSAARLHDMGVLKKQGRWTRVNAKLHPELAKVDKLLREGQNTRESLIKRFGLMPSEALHQRLNLVAETMGSESARDGGILPPIPKGMRRLYRGEGENFISYKDQGIIPDGSASHYFSTDRTFAKAHDTGGGLHYVDVPVGIAKDYRSGAGTYELPDTIAAKMKKVPREGTGIRTGENYTDLGLSKKQMVRYPRAVGSPISGLPKSPIKKVTATGEGIRQGLIPDNTLAGAARSLREMRNYQAKFEHRMGLGRYGSDVKIHHSDLLEADPSHPRWGKVTQAIRQAAGSEESTVHTLEDEGRMAALQAHLDEMSPHQLEGHEFNRPWQHGQELGTSAPEGYKWVPHEIADPATRSAAPRSFIGKQFNNINSAVTAATVYLKISHIPQRLATDATTSIFSGSLFSPKSLRLAMQMRKELGEATYENAVQLTGVHGYIAMPHEENSFASRTAMHGIKVKGRTVAPGAEWYAHVIDSPFRWLNLTHEARLRGLTTSGDIKKMMKWAENPNLHAKNANLYNQILMRTNRTSMMYDGLTPRERATVARALWFYPWTKAAVRFGGHVAIEHPIKAGVAANLGLKGRKEQKKVFGALPSFGYGYTPIGGRISGLGSLSPFNTVGQSLDLASGAENLSQNANPATAAALSLATGLNNFGEVGGGRIHNALTAMVQPMPEFSILHDYLDSKGAGSKTRIFPHNPSEDFLTRFLVGPPYPRKYRKKNLHRAYKREHPVPGYDIHIPFKKGG